MAVTHGSLFSGIGGFDLAAEWMGWENVFHCEWNDFGQKVLKHYWPNATSYGDITKTDFSIHRGSIDIISGGFPCQPYSMAGKRKGKEDDRHLWPEMLRAIREIQPRWVVGENVLGLVNWSGGLVFHEVQADLEAAGYEVWPYVLPACAKNAPHRRDRIWFVAKDTNSDGRRGDQRKEKSGVGGFGNAGTGNNEWLQADNGEVGSFTHSESESSEWLRPEQCESCNTEQRQLRGTRSQMGNRDAADTSNQGLQWGKVNGSIAGIRKNGNKQFAGYFPSNWQKFPTQSPICSGNDGLPAKLDGITFSKWRNESIKAAGNAIVPQVVYQIFKAIELYDKNECTY